MRTRVTLGLVASRVESLISFTVAGVALDKFFRKSLSMMRTTSSLRSRTANSGSAGAATISIPVCCFIQSTNAGAFSTPATGSLMSSAFRPRPAITLNIVPMSRGPITAPTSMVETERRSRSPSRTSFLNTVMIIARVFNEPPPFPGLQASRRRLPDWGAPSMPAAHPVFRRLRRCLARLR